MWEDWCKFHSISTLNWLKIHIYFPASQKQQTQHIEMNWIVQSSINLDLKVLSICQIKWSYLVKLKNTSVASNTLRRGILVCFTFWISSGLSVEMLRICWASCRLIPVRLEAAADCWPDRPLARAAAWLAVWGRSSIDIHHQFISQLVSSI